MAKRKTFREIAAMLRKRLSFTVRSENERKDVLLAAAAQDIEVSTRANDAGGFTVFYTNHN